MLDLHGKFALILLNVAMGKHRKAPSQIAFFSFLFASTPVKDVQSGFVNVDGRVTNMFMQVATPPSSPEAAFY